MTQKSGFWDREGSTPVGDQLDGYNQIVWSDAASILASCSGFEGVGAGFLNGLEVTTTGLNEVTVDTGGAVVDGKWYKNDAGEAVAIPSAVGGGNTRIDRIVLRCSWAGYTVRVHRIAGTDAGSPTAPAITQTSGTTYDIQLAQVLVDTSGNCVVTDERTWAIPEVDNVSLEIVNGKLTIKDYFDVVHLVALQSFENVVVEDDLKQFPVPDIHNGKDVVRLFAWLSGAPSSSGAVVARVYNVTKTQAVGLITISQGARVGSTTSITNPALSENDVLRVDITSEGVGAKGLEVQIKVDKK